VILVDTSVWIDHLKRGNAKLGRLLDGGSVLTHPWVIGELALGNLRRRSEVLRLLMGLSQTIVASDQELIDFIDRETLSGTGIGYVDAQLLASTRITPDTRLWTGERRLASLAARLGVCFDTAKA
jgi:predicted nucleic acid-binding protein